MTKSALLDLIHQVSTISDQEVAELEKLVQNFPYCQTAHLLIAKASYDKGNMLSNQKLRKAAAYATNRHLLKKLIYTTDAAVSLAALALIPPGPEVPAPRPETVESLPAPAENIPADQLPEPNAPRFASSLAPTDVTALDVPAEEALPTSAEENQPKESVIATVADTTNSDTYTIAESASIKEDLPSVANALLAATAEFSIAATPAEKPEVSVTDEPEPAPVLTYLEPPVSFTGPELDELLQIEHFTRSNSVGLAVESDLVVLESNLPESDLPKNTIPEAAAVAENSVESLPEPEALPIIGYELEAPDEPEEVPLEPTLTNSHAYLFQPEPDEHPTGELKAATPEEFNYEVYLRNQLGYWLGSSRLGELLQVKDELTTHTPLQFYPDLILEYSKQNYLTPTDSPPVSNVNRQFAIIDQFLKTNPKLKSFGSDKVRTEPQDDLAFKSTKNTRNLTSENLAAIMVQQGKIKKAIKIYEQLMVKIPEKKAYFTAQIQKLQNLP